MPFRQRSPKGPRCQRGRRGPEGVVLSIGFANSSLAKPRDAHTLAPLGPLRAYIAGEGPQRGLPGGRLVVAPSGQEQYIAQRGPEGATSKALLCLKAKCLAIARPKGRPALLLPLRGNEQSGQRGNICPKGLRGAQRGTSFSPLLVSLPLRGKSKAGKHHPLGPLWGN